MTTVAGLIVSGPVAGVIYMFTGKGKSLTPRLVVANNDNTNSELSFNYGNFLKKGVNKTVSFEEAKLSFNGYQLKVGDILCSPGQNGKFFVLNEISDRKGRATTYKIMGYSENYTTTGCNWNKFPKRIKGDESKTIYLKEFAGPKYLRGYGWSAGIGTIYISSCSFELKKKDNQFSSNAKWGIAWNNCKQNEYGKNPWDFVPTTQLGVNYEIK